MTFPARLTELIENATKGPWCGRLLIDLTEDDSDLCDYLINHAEAIRDLVVAAEKVRHWHDASNDGMIVSAESVRGLWEALAKLKEPS